MTKPTGERRVKGDGIRYMKITQITATATEKEGPIIFGVNERQEVCVWNYLTCLWEIYGVPPKPITSVKRKV